MADEKNSGYNNAQLFSMQQDAVRRVNEMQRLARERVIPNSQHSQPQGTRHDTNHSPPPAHTQQHHDDSPEILPTQIVEKGGFAGILEKLNLDDEKIMILMLLLLLVNEGADNMLVLALVYILI